MGVGDGNHRHVAEFFVEGEEIGDVEPPVQGGELRDRDAARQREVEIVDVEMKDVKFGGLLEGFFDQQDEVGDLVEAVFVQAQGAPAGGHQPRLGHRVAAGKQRHLVALAHQLFGEVGDDPFRAPVVLRGDAFNRRRYLGNPHSHFSPPLRL